METLRLLSKTAGSNEYEAEVERLLSCPICLEVYSKPVVILPCQHNLCRKCANDVFQNRGTPMGSGGRFRTDVDFGGCRIYPIVVNAIQLSNMLREEPRSSLLSLYIFNICRCPTCRYEVMLDRHGVYGLQRNILVENIIDMYQSESKKPFRKAEVLMCDEHEEEKVNIFCISCQKPTCSLCKVFGQHQNCSVSPMDKVYKDHKTELSGAISMLVAGNDRLQTVISNTEEMAAITEENSKKAQNEVSSSFDQLYAILEQRKQAMLSQIKAASHEKSEILQSMLTEYGVQLQSSSKLVEEALSLLEEPSQSQFLLISRDVINRVTSTARDAEVPKPPQSIQSADAFTIDISDYVDYLKQINFTGEVLDSEFSEISSALRKDIVGGAVNKSAGEIYHAKMLLPSQNTTEEVVAAARVTKTVNDDDDIPSTSDAVKSDRVIDRKDSYDNCAGLDQLDEDVKAIAERYLTNRTPRRRSYACSQGDAFGLNDGRMSSPSDEETNKMVTNTERNLMFDDLTKIKSLLYRRKLSSQCDDNMSQHSSTQNSSRANSPSNGRSTRISTGKPQRVLRFQTDEQSSVNNQGPVLGRPSGNRRIDSRKRQRAYATHRRRTWSHLLDKKP